MFQFETQLKKLKHEVLTEVARLAKNGELSTESIEKIPYEIIREGELANVRLGIRFKHQAAFDPYRY